MRRTKKTNFTIKFYIHFLNYLLIFTVLLLKYLDIYYTLILLEDSQVSETNPFAQLVLQFDPIIVYLISLVPISLFFIVNYYLRNNVIFLTGLMIIMIIFIFYLTPIVQNSFYILEQVNGI